MSLIFITSRKSNRICDKHSQRRQGKGLASNSEGTERHGDFVHHNRTTTNQVW